MPVIFAFLVPCATVAYLLLFHRAAVSWWEPLLLLAVCGLVVAGVSLAADASAGQETEFRSTWVAHADYVEPWDEEVPCRHPKYRTETYTDGEGHTQTREVFDGYQHPYDVDYHPAEYLLYGANGDQVSTGEADWKRLVAKFGNNTRVDMHRNYHSIDGDLQRTAYPAGDEGRMEPLVTESWYRNPTQAEGSTFRYRAVPEAEVKQYGLYARPELGGGYSVPSVLGYESTSTVLLDRLNAVLGTGRHVRVTLLVYRGQPLEASYAQEAYWKGGRRDELTVTLGLDAAGTVQWARAFSWSTDHTLGVEARDYLVGQKSFDLPAFAAWLRPEVAEKWACRDFADFDYLHPAPEWWAVLIAWIVVAGVSVGMAVWTVGNEFDSEDLPTRSDFLSGFLLLVRDAWGKVLSWLRDAAASLGIRPRD